MLRLTLGLLFCLGLLGQGRQPVDPATLARVEGRVYNAATGEPLRKAQVMLHAGGLGEFPATSDATGHFAIERVPPGTYSLTVQHQNFALLDYGATRPGVPGKRLTLSASQSMTGLEFKLTPFGVIAGRVTDQDGDPVAGVPITVLRWGFIRGQRQLLPSGGGNSTNDRGEFRIYNLPAGRYFVAARPIRTDNFVAMTGTTGQVTAPQREPARETYASTFYPATIDPASAAPVVLVAGQEQPGIDIQLRKTRIYTVEGKLSGGQRGARYSLALQPQESAVSGSFGMSRTAAVRQDDWSFAFRGITPGRYTLSAMVENRVGARQELVIGDGDLEGVVVPLLEPGVVKGRVQAEPGLTKPNLKGVRISLTPVDGTPMNPPNAGSAEDGSFSMADVPADRYRVVASPMEGAYLKTIRWAGQAVNESVEMPAAGNATLDLVYAPTKAQLEGDVKTADDQPAPNVAVLLMPASRRESDFRLMMADQNGHFVAKSVAPGSYAVLATDSSIFSLPDPAVVKALEKVTTAVTVEENGRATVSLKMIPEAAIEALQ